MKKLIALLLAVMLLVPAFALADNVIKIGVFEPSTGDNGAGGKQEILGIEYANSLAPTVTIGGEEYTVELVIEDNQSLTDKAISAAQSLVSKDVAVVLGSYGSGVSMAGGDVFAEAGVPAIGVSCTNPNVTLLCDYYWRICFLDPFQGTVMANFAKELGATKAYVLTMLGEDYGVGLGKYFVEAFKGLGGEVVEENFTEGTSDFAAYINNAVSNGCDVVFAVAVLFCCHKFNWIKFRHDDVADANRRKAQEIARKQAIAWAAWQQQQAYYGMPSQPYAQPYVQPYGQAYSSAASKPLPYYPGLPTPPQQAYPVAPYPYQQPQQPAPYYPAAGQPYVQQQPMQGMPAPMPVSTAPGFQQQPVVPYPQQAQPCPQQPAAAAQYQQPVQAAPVYAPQVPMSTPAQIPQQPAIAQVPAVQPVATAPIPSGVQPAPGTPTKPPVSAEQGQNHTVDKEKTPEDPHSKYKPGA